METNDLILLVVAGAALFAIYEATKPKPVYQAPKPAGLFGSGLTGGDVATLLATL